MSGDRQPRPGDRVKVTYEAILDEIKDDGRVYVHSDDKTEVAYVPAAASVEVLELADDPSKDPIGTVRQASDGTVVVLNASPTRDPWLTIAPADPGTWARHPHAAVVGWPVIGAVPGTPAAEQHMHNAGYCGACNRVHDRREYVPPVASEVIDASTLFPPPVGTAPRVFTSDGPEPPEDVTILEKVDYPENRGFPFTKRGAYGWTNCETPDADTSNVHGFNWPPGYNMTFREVIA